MQEIVHRIRTFASQFGPVLQFKVYSDTGLLSAQQREALVICGVELLDVPHISLASMQKDASDKMIILDMCFFALDFVHRVNHLTCILISGDSDFSPLINRLAQRGIRIVLVVPPTKVVPTMMLAVHKVVAFHDLIGLKKKQQEAEKREEVSNASIIPSPKRSKQVLALENVPMQEVIQEKTSPTNATHAIPSTTVTTTTIPEMDAPKPSITYQNNQQDEKIKKVAQICLEYENRERVPISLTVLGSELLKRQIVLKKVRKYLEQHSAVFELGTLQGRNELLVRVKSDKPVYNFVPISQQQQTALAVEEPSSTPSSIPQQSPVPAAQQQQTNIEESSKEQ